MSIPSTLSWRRSAGFAAVDDIVGDDLALEREELRVGGINRHQHPMGVRPAEGFDPREVLKQPFGLLAVERLVDAEEVRVAV